MKCAQCGAESPAGMKFCGQCGAPLVSTCPSCGADNPPEHKFCGHCGSPLASGAGARVLSNSLPDPPPLAVEGRLGVSTLPGEMKQVTVLFCDIVNSTSLTERLGPEGMRDLVRAFLYASLAEIRRFGGTAPQFTGDGFMALFGAPLTHEDHVRRALLAALAIQRALHEGGAMVGRELDELEVRIGIHTGPVVFGPVADNLSMDYTVIGDTANVAARLQQVAEPGAILISEATRWDTDEDGPVLLHLLEIKDVAKTPALSNPEAVKSKAFEMLRQLTVKRSIQHPLVLEIDERQLSLHSTESVAHRNAGWGAWAGIPASGRERPLRVENRPLKWRSKLPPRPRSGWAYGG